MSENTKAKMTPEAKAKKMLKDTKLLPLIVVNQENFTKSVHAFSKKTKHCFSDLMHLDAARDFRVDQCLQTVATEAQEIMTQHLTGERSLGEEEPMDVDVEENGYDDCDDEEEDHDAVIEDGDNDDDL